MRIPDPYFELGQKVPRLQAGPVPSSAPGEAVGNAAARLGGALLGVAADEIDFQGRQRLQEAQEKKAEADRLEKIKREGEARTVLFSHERVLSQVADTLARDTNLSPQEKREQFFDQADKVRGSLFGSIPEEYQYAFGPSFNEHRDRAEDALETFLKKDLQDEIRAGSLTTLEAIVNSPKPAAQRLALLHDPNVVDWEAAGYSETERVQVIARLSEEIDSGEVEAEIAKDPRKALANLNAVGKNSEYSHYRYLGPKTREAYKRTSRSAIEAQEREAERRRREAETSRLENARAEIAWFKEAKEGLFPIDPKREARFWRAVAGTPYEDQAKEIRKRTGALGFVAGKVQEDPLRYGAAQLGVSVPGLSVDDPGAWPGQLAARGKVAGAIKQAHGLPYLPVLTNDEAKGLSGLLKTQTPQAQVQTAAALGTSVGKDSALHIARQFAAADPLLGLTVALSVSGRDKGAYHVAAGRHLIEAKGYTLPKPTADSVAREFDKQMGEALSGMPQNRAALLEAARAAYISRAAEAGIAPAEFDKKIFREALALVAQGTAKVNGRRVLLPEGVNEGQFLTNWRRIDAGRIESAGGVYGFKSAADAAETIRDDAEPWEAGGGRYRFAVDGKFLLTADGTRPLEIDLSDLAGQRMRIER